MLRHGGLVTSSLGYFFWRRESADCRGVDSPRSPCADQPSFSFEACFLPPLFFLLGREKRVHTAYQDLRRPGLILNSPARKNFSNRASVRGTVVEADQRRGFGHSVP